MIFFINENKEKIRNDIECRFDEKIQCTVYYLGMRFGLPEKYNEIIEFDAF